MMRIMDLHADIGWNIERLHREGQDGVLAAVHVPNLQKGGILDCAAACFFSGKQSWQDMKSMIQNTRREIEMSDVAWIRKPADLNDQEERVSMIMTVEGMCGVKTDVVNRIDWMYEQGIRIASLAWNDENALATGLGGDPARGLTEKGKTVIAEMNRLHMVVDISHANEHTFWDILSTSRRPIIATHSNARSLCNHRRNLTDEQIRALAGKGGIIGMNAWDAVISLKKAEKNAAGLARQARYIADLVGVEHVACGFDFMDYYPDEHTIPSNIDRAVKAQNFIHALGAEGFSDQEIEGIAYGNAFRFLKENM